MSDTKTKVQKSATTEPRKELTPMQYAALLVRRPPAAVFREYRHEHRSGHL